MSDSKNPSPPSSKPAEPEPAVPEPGDGEGMHKVDQAAQEKAAVEREKSGGYD